MGFSIALLFSNATPNNPWFPYYDRLTNFELSDPHTGRDLAHIVGPEQDVGEHESDEEVHALENLTVAKQLQEKVKVLCWIMTKPGNHKTKARHVMKTWGKRCNKLLFMSSKYDEELNSIALNVSEGRNHLWEKTKAAFQYVYKNYLDEYDWFVKADDDT